MGALDFFDDGGDRRRGARPLLVREGSRGVIVNSMFFRVLCVVWLGQLSSACVSVPVCPSVCFPYQVIRILIIKKKVQTSVISPFNEKIERTEMD